MCGRYASTRSDTQLVAEFAAAEVGGNSAGKLPYRGIIHVTGLNMAWRATAESIQLSVLNAIEVAKLERFRSLALPVIGAGSGGFNEVRAVELIEETAAPAAADLDIRLVRFVG